MSSPPSTPLFPPGEYDARVTRVRERMLQADLDALLVSSPENIYYLCGLDHMGYFAYQMLIVPADGPLTLVTRAMERATVRDQVPDITHVGYADGGPAVPPSEAPAQEVVMAATSDDGRADGLRPWEMSVGLPARSPGETPAPSAQVAATVDALEDAGLTRGRLGLEKGSSFLPFGTAEALTAAVPAARWQDASGLVDDCRIVQSPRELVRTRQAAVVSDAMMWSAIAAAGPGVATHDVMAAVYDTMFRRGGTYPGFVPLVRSTRTLDHEHGTWQAGRLRKGDLLFLEMAGCVRRYHAPLGRLVFIGRIPARAARMQRICHDAMMRAADVMRPDVEAGTVYQRWHAALDEAGLHTFTRHHCGYAVGIGYPPSWSGSGVPVGLRPGSTMRLRAGMVFHLMSWLLRTGKGDFFLSDTALVTAHGGELLTTVNRDVVVR